MGSNQFLYEFGSSTPANLAEDWSAQPPHLDTHVSSSFYSYPTVTRTAGALVAARSRTLVAAARGKPNPSSVAMSAYAGINWVLLEPFVIRTDDKDSFPERSIRASATTSWGADFCIAFSLAEPPHISHLYAKLPQPGFPGPEEAEPLAILGTHHHLALFRVFTKTPSWLLLQDFFIYNAAENSLELLPPCFEPAFDYIHGGLQRCHANPKAPRLLTTLSMGLWCLGDQFVVAELVLYRYSFTVFADICLLRNTFSPTYRNRYDGMWESMRVEILSADNPDDHDLWLLSCWHTEAIIPFREWLCWIDYNRGILFCDMSLPIPTVSFLKFPLDKFPPTSTRIATGNYQYRGVSVIANDRELKFVDIARDDGIPFGALEPGTGFTITCHTLALGDGTISSMKWELDYRVTSSELWDTNKDRLPHDILMFPRVDIYKPHVVHFLYIEFGYVRKNMWAVSIDMITKTMESLSLHINRKDGLQSDFIWTKKKSMLHDLIGKKSRKPTPFLVCEFPRFLHLSTRFVKKEVCRVSSFLKYNL
ncbi:unnamed protein product [Urochloa humidicola]